MVSAKIIKHSQDPYNKEELITLEIQLHRFILPEFNTHRVMSRNFQSSRAIPINKMIEQVRNNPAMPVHWGKNQRGMQAENQLNDEEIEMAKEAWLSAAKEASYKAEVMNNIGVHKQLANRLLEPFMWTKGVVTATRVGWESFFTLRCHKDAQYEIQELAFRIKEAVDNSNPQILEIGDWHLPYVDNVNDFEDFEDAIKVSTSCCAQVSYRNLDTSLEKARKIYDMLNLPSQGVFKDEPPHCSPCEHQAMFWPFSGSSEYNIGGNFQTKNLYQYRKMLEKGEEKIMIKKTKRKINGFQK
jgi:thymidylate synthase ThyX